MGRTIVGKCDWHLPKDGAPSQSLGSPHSLSRTNRPQSMSLQQLDFHAIGNERQEAMVEIWDIACGPGWGNNLWELSQPALPVELVDTAVVSLEPWYQRLLNATSIQGRNSTSATTTKIVVFADASSLNSAVQWY
jgi:hypothetical protein